jgi:hypothetical protein
MMMSMSNCKVNLDKNMFVRLVELLISIFLIAYIFIHLNFVISAGDGVWILYATEVLKGGVPYKDLGYVQQPFFLLFSIPAALLYDYGIVYSKMYYITLPFLYLFVMYLTIRECKIGRLYTALTVVSIFFISTYFNAYRFDDYHVMAHLLVLVSLLFILRFENNSINVHAFIIFQSVIVSFCFLTRINEGVAIGVFLALYVLIRRPSLFFQFVSIQIAVLAVVLFSMLFILGDSFADWYVSSISKAAQIKGGLSLLDRPVRLVREAFNTNGRSIFGIVFLLCLLSRYIASDAYVKLVRNKYLDRLVFMVLSVLLIGLAFDIHASMQYSFVLLVVIVVYGFLGIVSSEADFRSYILAWVIYLFPLLLFFMGSLSSGGYIDDLWFPLAVFYIVALYKYSGMCLPGSNLLLLLIIFIVAMGLKLGLKKFQNPYAWHYYSSPSLISKREISRDGRDKVVVIDPELNDYAKKICGSLPKEAVVLSLPFPFANYFCGNIIWKKNIQLFFDTSTRERSDRLGSDLESDPPKYIVYQMQMVNLAAHEYRFNNNKPLPFRQIHELIIRKLMLNEWRVVRVVSTSNDCVWLVISTSPSSEMP